jgi:hypothetical protein
MLAILGEWGVFSQCYVWIGYSCLSRVLRTVFRFFFCAAIPRVGIGLGLAMWLRVGDWGSTNRETMSLGFL